MNVKRFITDIDELKLPFKEAVEDLKKENMSLQRELERYDQNFKKVFGDYIEVLGDYKGLIEKSAYVSLKLLVIPLIIKEDLSQKFSKHFIRT